jgi:hypothetical protein
MPFGRGMAWLAVESTKTRAVAEAVGLKGAREATWEEGVKAAHQSSVFVAPPLGDWTLIASSGLFPKARLDSFVRPIVERLSRQFGDAQYFCTQEKVGLAAWARARKGMLVRGYGWLAQTETILWNDGARTREERSLDIQFPHSPSPTSKPMESEQPNTPNEKSVMLLASLWSIDPSTLDEHFKEPLPGWMGTVRWSAG